MYLVPGLYICEKKNVSLVHASDMCQISIFLSLWYYWMLNSATHMYSFPMDFSREMQYILPTYGFDFQCKIIAVYEYGPTRHKSTPQQKKKQNKTKKHKSLAIEITVDRPKSLFEGICATTVHTISCLLQKKKYST